MARRCQALNKAGKPCGITSESKALDGSGRLAAEPLRRGGARCTFHARWWVSSPAAGELLATAPILVYIDLETTGLSLASADIVEIGALAESRAAFQTVVRPATLPSDAGVHGISPEEIAAGPSVIEALARLTAFLEHLSEAALSDDGSSDEGSALPRLRSRVPAVLLAAHNGARFDFPMILSQCWRCNVVPPELETWLYVDTIDVLRAVGGDPSCQKLQCQRSGRGLLVEACAHRALDDCVALSAVMSAAAESLGLEPCDLLARFAVKLDLAATAAELAFLL